MFFPYIIPQYFDKILIKIFVGIEANLPLDDWKLAILKLVKLISSILLTCDNWAQPYEVFLGQTPPQYPLLWLPLKDLDNRIFPQFLSCFTDTKLLPKEK